MNDPRRLLDEGGTPFERSLLGAIANERPSPELARRMRQGLAAAGVATTAKVAAAGFGKLAVVGLVGAGLAFGYVALEDRRPEPAPARSVAAAPVAPLASVTAAPPPAIESSAPASVPAPRPRSAPSAAGDLREEIRLLDLARAAVRGGEHRQALMLLGRYDRRYPRGQFRQEVQVLRVEALELGGNEQAARALGKKFLAEHPDSPHVERVESVTGSER